MYTSLLLFALTSSLAPAAAVSEPPAWLHDYATASKEGQAHRKPLAVFIGSGSAGWQKLSKEGKLADSVKKVLQEDYVCLYLNTEQANGRRLAQLFDVPEGLGLVLSDRSGERQAFHHAGELANQDLERYLRKYADPGVVVRKTETDLSEEVRYYPPQTSPAAAQPVYAPAPAFAPAPSFGFSGGRSC